MIFEKAKNLNHTTLAISWIILSLLAIGLFSLGTRMSYFKIDALSIWIFSCIIILYQSRKPIRELSPVWGRNIIILGLFICAFSFLNIPLGFGNPPYSIGDFSIFLSGVGLVFFGLFRIKTYLFPVAIPFIAVMGFQVYELFLVNEQTLSAPLLPFTIFFGSVLLSVLGIPATINGDLVYYISKTGAPIYLQITPECTGIWSLGTFTIMALLVLSTFPEALKKRSTYLLIGIGYLGTYAGNILRIGAIAMSGYLYGPTGAIEQTHLYFGWIFFLCWMIVFWYIFFTRILGISFRKDKGRSKQEK
jgi:exosortase/archaeosortase family protein